VEQLYPQVLGSLVVTSYDSQGYGRSIPPRLHKGISRQLHATAALTQGESSPVSVGYEAEEASEPV
jgi:hypothetical protein